MEKDKKQNNKNKKKEFIKEDFSFLHIMGPHAGEGEKSIWQRKLQDIQLNGFTFWITKCIQCKQNQVADFIQKSKLKNAKKEHHYVLFLAPSTKGGAKDTKTAQIATHFAQIPVFQDQSLIEKKLIQGDDKSLIWKQVPITNSDCSGLINKNTMALVFDEIQQFGQNEKFINLWDYGEFKNKAMPIKFHLGKTIAFSVLNDTSKHQEKSKSNIRQVVAIGRLKADSPLVFIKEQKDN
ncbi:hypothetical protein PPERSA_08170 [Pseudocohnilembus persalinus]|uniref:Uncharacterized protein n=1 Tax=Pseudocohnilembus persalinus TaxID=266149 RepID=A0A0V0R393_PSEPJ|nr:hypothetical protein PPERSA_08170 [Pseudocohnilembus persalinus]|eukprot:KRX08967.1 hypothetical protein PPERSA_08170 [Pseudocohnilembus persalinus]